MIKFSSDNNLNFTTLGFTSTLTGITLSTVLIDTTTGQGVTTSIVPTSLNYVKGGLLSGSVFGSSYQGFNNNKVSLTTQGSRMVEIKFQPSDITTDCFIQITNLLGASQVVGQFRCIRGLSTVVGIESVGLPQVIQSQITSLNAISFLDLAPNSGAATYLIECQTGSGVAATGNSVAISFSNLAVFVRQI